MPRLVVVVVVCKRSCIHSVTEVLPLDCAPFTLFSFILSKSRCPVLTAGLRIYLRKEYCMFNNKKREKNATKKGEKLQQQQKKKGVIYIFKLHAQRLGRSHLE